ncbi:helix-turn-helix domain-containing protein [Kaistella sp.]|uniref:helix-turn-helix domain-containing protein n=1 Tax=Kaistella sp. TaxID=2782235 RepID=UPI00359FD9EC
MNPFLLEKNKSKKDEDQVVYAKLYQLEARNLIALKKLDTAEKNLQISSDYAQNQQSSFALISKENQYLKATLEFEKGNITEALKIADQLLLDLQSIPRAKYLFAITQQLRGQLFFEQQKYDQAIECLQKALKLVDNINYTALKSNLYEDLAKNYLVINNDKEFKFYKDQYRETSKILEENKKEARRELILLGTELKTENNKSYLEKKQNQWLYLCGISIFVLSLLTYIFIREVQRGKSLIKQIRFFRSIKLKQNEPVKADVKTKEVPKKQLIIPKETEQQILQGLQEFEESKKYLDNNMSLATLAVELETNTKYLSEIINKYKDKNFNTYINELRIKYVIHLLSTDRSYLQYKISYIAEIGGFTSHSAFTNVFKIITGMSPQEYMQTLRNN